MHVIALGFGLGFVVAAAIGPISLLCIRIVLRGASAAGIAIGAGVLAVLGARTLWSALRVRLGGESLEEVASRA